MIYVWAYASSFTMAMLVSAPLFLSLNAMILVI